MWAARLKGVDLENPEQCLRRAAEADLARVHPQGP